MNKAQATSTAMDKGHIARIAAALGLPKVPEDWSGIDPVLPLLEHAKSEGAVLVLKLDGERGPKDTGPYTVVASGGPLGDDFIRIDEQTLDAALVHVLCQYAARCWRIPLPA